MTNVPSELPQVPRTGNVVVNRAMSLDGFIAGPGHAMRWFNGRRPDDYVPRSSIREAASRTGAMLVGRRTWDVGEQLQADEPGSDEYPFTGAMFLLTHRPPEPPLAGVTVLSGDIGDAVDRARAAAGGKDVELLGSDVAAQAFRRGLVDEVLVYVLPVVLGAGIPFSPAGSVAVELEQIGSTQAGEVTILRYRVRR